MLRGADTYNQEQRHEDDGVESEDGPSPAWHLVAIHRGLAPLVKRCRDIAIHGGDLTELIGMLGLLSRRRAKENSN